jgi:pimeloyl-ACP methyl ester carboxylesterase
MATYVLLHGASSDSFHWHLVEPRLRALGHDVVAPDMPVEDDDAGFAEYTDAVVDAIGDQRDLVVVAQSLSGFVGPMVCERVPVDLLVMACAMTPRPGESGGDWWVNTGYTRAGRPDVLRDFFHDVPADVVRTVFARRELDQSSTPFAKPWAADRVAVRADAVPGGP